MTDTMISKMIEAGAKRWTKGSMDRLYINWPVLASVIEKNNLAEEYTWNGVISNSYRRQLSSAKTYVDVADGSIHTSDKMLKAAAEIMLAAAQ